MQTQRAIVYIDGFNLHYGMRAAYRGRHEWLDLQALAQNLLRPRMELVKVKYFTAAAKGIASGGKRRQEIYLKALQTHCGKLETFYGNFLTKTMLCRECGKAYTLHEEKKTDVNLACEILNDAYQDHFDCCYVVSGDSDLVPPIASLNRHHPGKRSVVCHPPRRKNTELCGTASAWYPISRQMLARSQLPRTVMLPSGRPLTRPTEWT